MIGTRLGRYEIVSLLGEGGSGKVYEAILHGPAGFRKPVALKLLHRPERAVGLQHEARLGGLLKHPNLIETYELGEVDGVWFCAMELVTGGSLARYAPMPPRAVVDVGLQVCAGLGYAHETVGLVHNDLKPQNLLLQDGVVRIADFDVALARGALPRRGGTPGFMSPELMAGEAVDARSDLYALGCVLVALATGSPPTVQVQHRPFDSTPPQSWDGSTDDRGVPATPPPIEVVVPDWLEPVVPTCLQTDPARRYPDARALAEALRALDVPGLGLEELTLDDGPRAWWQGSATPVVPGSSTGVGAAADRFVGRDDEVRTVLKRLSEPGAVVTLCGIGGIGKTRLALEVSRALQASWSVLFCPVMDAHDEIALVAAIAQRLRVPIKGDDTAQLTEQLGHALAARGPALLVLDDVRADVAALVEQCLRHAPALRIVTTSHRPLGLRGAWVHRLGPLDPVAGVALVRDRAALGGAALEDDDALNGLVHELDGLPLALELAAGRLVTIEPTALLERIHKRLDLVSTTRGDRPTRHRSLRAVLDSSWEALTLEERHAVAALSVFRGGFTLDAAEAVLPRDTPWVLDQIDGLFHQCWVRRRADARPDAPRFDLLETTRTYAAEQLDASGRRSSAEQAHGAYFAGFGSPEVQRRFLGRDGATLRRDLAQELANLEAACERAVLRHEVDEALGAFDAAWAVLRLLGPPRRTRALADRIFEGLSLPPTGTSRVLRVRGWSRREQGAFDEALPLLRDALTAAEASGDLHERLQCRLALAEALLYSGERDVARTLLEEALALSPDAAPIERGDVLVKRGNLAIECAEDSLAWFGQALSMYRRASYAQGVATAQGNRAPGLFAAGDLAGARDAIEEARAAFAALGDRYNVAVATGNRGYVATDPAQALADFGFAAEVARELGMRHALGFWLVNVGRMQAEQGDGTAARATLSEATALAKAVGDDRGLGNAQEALATALEAEGDRTAAQEALVRAEAAFGRAGAETERARVEERRDRDEGGAT